MAKYKLIKSEEQQTTEWSGGTTTELCIYPDGANYAERNFDFRISSAVVQCEKSEFTPLPSVYRYLMILDGEISVSHENQHTVKLKKFDVDEFWGDWHTVSIGKARDFNLMCRNNLRGNLAGFELGDEKSIHIPENCKWYGLYLCHGAAKLQWNGESATLCHGDFILFSELTDLRQIFLTPEEKSEIVEVQIFS